MRALSVGLTAALLSPLAAVGQPRAIVVGQDTAIEISLDTGATRTIPGPPAPMTDFYGRVAIDGGRYLVEASALFGGTFVVRAWSPLTGEIMTSAPFALAGTSLPQVVGDANRARAFLWNGDAISVVTTSGIEEIIDGVSPLPPDPYGRDRLMAFSPLPETLFVVRQGATPELAQFHADGTFIRATALPDLPISLAATSDGAMVFVVSQGPAPGEPWTLTKYDGATGAPTASTSPAPGAPPALYGPQANRAGRSRESGARAARQRPRGSGVRSPTAPRTRLSRWSHVVPV